MLVINGRRNAGTFTVGNLRRALEEPERLFVGWNHNSN